MSVDLDLICRIVAAELDEAQRARELAGSKVTFSSLVAAIFAAEFVIGYKRELQLVEGYIVINDSQYKRHYWTQLDGRIGDPGLMFMIHQAEIARTYRRSLVGPDGEPSGRCQVYKLSREAITKYWTTGAREDELQLRAAITNPKKIIDRELARELARERARELAREQARELAREQARKRARELAPIILSADEVASPPTSETAGPSMAEYKYLPIILSAREVASLSAREVASLSAREVVSSANEVASLSAREVASSANEVASPRAQSTCRVKIDLDDLARVIPAWAISSGPSHIWLYINTMCDAYLRLADVAALPSAVLSAAVVEFLKDRNYKSAAAVCGFDYPSLPDHITLSNGSRVCAHYLVGVRMGNEIYWYNPVSQVYRFRGEKTTAHRFGGCDLDTKSAEFAALYTKSPEASRRRAHREFPELARMSEEVARRFRT